MNIIYACNDSYIPQTGISIISVCENNKDVKNITFYFLSDNVKQENLDILQNIIDRYERMLIVMPFQSLAYDLQISNVGRHIATIYAKVFFSRIPGLNKAIYLDSDIVVVRSLKKLWEIDLRDCYMGVVQTFSKSKSMLGLHEDYKFFNDGMAIVNVDYCRNNDLIGKVKKVIEKFDGAPPVLSEGALNVVCQGHVRYISFRYNLMSGILYFNLLNNEALSERLTAYDKDDINESCANPVCIHYLSAFYNRPWFYPCTHPYKNEYYKYKALSPWEKDKLVKKNIPVKLQLINFCFKLFGYGFCSNIQKLCNRKIL
jgi:lipopolysaccharide biosynthesis glycosyltransferase